MNVYWRRVVQAATNQQEMAEKFVLKIYEDETVVISRLLIITPPQE